MSKVLSQWEIDALLSTIGDDSPSGSSTPSVMADRAIKLYDFRRPDKFSKDHIRAIQNVHETFARLTASALTSFLRAPTSVHLTSVEQVVFDEYVQQLASPTIANLVELQPLEGRIVVELNMKMTLAMLDRMMGGAGRMGNRREELTDIEIALVRNLSGSIVAGLKDSWSMVSDLKPVLAETVLSSEFVQAALPGDIAALLLFEVQTLGTSGVISICVPHPVIEPIMDQLSTQLWFSSSRKGGSEDDRFKLMDRLREVSLPMAAELGSTSITVSELNSLAIGDVIRLDRSIEADLIIRVGEHGRFLGRPGVSAGNRAIQVTGTVRQEMADAA
jgi:flagellar motor switch protein FliM